jgi:predicted Zn-dependent protease
MQYPQLYQTLGKAQERLGQQVAARESMATFYQFTGALAAAMSQLQQARTLSSDFYEQSLIDVRVQKIRQMMSDERSLLERFKS